MMDNPSYYAIIPANVRYDKNLKANEKLLYGEITALCGKDGYCWATNEYFAGLYGVKKNQVSIWINNLIQQGYLNAKIIFKKNTKQIEKRILSINHNIKNFNDPIMEKSDTYYKKKGYPIMEKSDTPIMEKSEENNTSIEYYKNNNISVDNFSNEKIDDKKTDIIDNDFLEFAKGIKSIVENKKRIKVNHNQLISWAKEVKKLFKKIAFRGEEQAKEDIKKAIQFLIDHTNEQYVPVVESGKSFFEKFSKIEDAMNRQKNKDVWKLDTKILGLEDFSKSF
jgi:hypothetical protein